jgi:hypothetical protein
LAPADSLAERRSRLYPLGIWGIPLAGLIALWLWLAFSAGGFIKDQWLLPSMALGFFGLVVSALAAYPHRPQKLSLAVMALFASYSLLVALSALWADSPTRAWFETTRTFSYLLVLALAIVYLGDGSARKLFRYLVMGGALILLAVCLVKLGSAGSDGIAGLFIQKRFSYPVSYPNNAAALFLVSFWPLIWLAAGPEERAPIRALSLGLATGLLGLAFLTQSRGAIWSLLITLLLTFVISPARLRTLLYLLVPALLMLYVFPRLNRYWTLGPETIGGGLAVRTVAAAAVAAGFIGLILAFLERWIRVSRRMNTIFGTVVLLGAAVGACFWILSLTAEAGGPTKWLSQTWRQFSGQQAEEPRAESASRFTMVTSSGRVTIWRVAVQEFESAPLLGVGADNFVFQYDRLRTKENYKPKQAHSFELQVLGETGVVGGVFAFGGVLLAAGGLLWPRCSAGRRGAKDTGLRRRRSTGPPESVRSPADQPEPRWGNDSLVYGWEMALFAGCAYWLVHASVDWLWQMAGVTIPAVLLLAAGVAGVDARTGSCKPSFGHQDRAAATRGPLSHVFRLLLLVLSLAVLALAGLPYVSLQFQDSARALAEEDVFRAAKRAETAHWLLPGDPEPYETQASIYGMSASDALVSDNLDRGGAVLDSLALRLASCAEAVTLEPADWSVQKAAGVAALELYLARGYVEGWALGFEYDDLSGSPTGADDWSSLAGVRQVAPGAAADSPVQDETTLADVKYYLGRNQGELASVALGYLRAAKDRNPLASQIDLDLRDLALVAPATVGTAP